LVIAVSCQFCRYVGCEAAVGKKRQRPRTIKTLVFQGTWFRSEQYREHYWNQQPGAWAEYQRPSPDEQDKLFDGKVARAKTLRKYVDLSSDMVEFVVKKTIVGDVIDDMFYLETHETDSSDEDADEEKLETPCPPQERSPVRNAKHSNPSSRRMTKTAATDKRSPLRSIRPRSRRWPAGAQRRPVGQRDPRLLRGRGWQLTLHSGTLKYLPTM
jgi:hypothetical protein